MTRVSMMFALLMLACRGPGSREPAPGSAGFSTPSAMPIESLDQAGALIRLMRMQIEGDDAFAAEVAINCELFRLNRTIGTARTRRLNAAARDSVYRGVPDSIARRIDNALATRVLTANQGCDSLARAGILGDTAYPTGRFLP